MNNPANPRPTIARIWRGRTTAARADEYAGYLYEHGIRPLEAKALERDPDFVIELPRSVQVLDIVAASGRTGGDT
jgi:hypothetical protein